MIEYSLVIGCNTNFLLKIKSRFFATLLHSVRFTESSSNFDTPWG